MTEAIGATASITLLTALPGSGKTLRLVQWMDEAQQRGEHVFVCNVEGLALAGVTPMEDPTKWQDLPAGSVLVVDEAQRYFRATRAGEPPAYLTAMETIRHTGVRLILATQQPNYLHSHLRGLVGLHEHMKRREGKQESTIYRNDEIMDDTRSASMAVKYDNEVWQFPAKYFAYYKSAQVHTVQHVESSKWKRWKKIFLVMGLGLVTAIGLVVWKIAGKGGESAPAAPLAAQAGQTLAASRDHDKEPPLTVEQFTAQLIPRIPQMPISAPIYDGKEAVSHPAVYCMSSQASCTCLTEQGTRFTIPEERCVDMARNGPAYDPFKAPTQAAPPPQEPSQESAARRSVVGLDGEPGQVGTPHQGNVWGKAPDTLSSDWK